MIRRVLGAVLGCAITLGVVAATRARAHPTRAQVDLVFRGGRIVDGTGRAAYLGDVAIAGDRVVMVGDVPKDVRATREVDVSGLTVAPGFIDMLGQSERTIFRHPNARSKIAQGVTSELAGEVESPWPAWRMDGRTSGYASLDDYFTHLRRVPPAINIGLFVSLGTVRGAVMGMATEAPSDSQMAAMRQMVDHAMCDGAFGVSGALLYPPASYFSTDELTVLAGRAAARGGGYATHLRSESDRLLPAVDEAIAIGRNSGAWVQLHHLKAAGRQQWGRMGEVVARVRAAREDGVRVTGDVYPYLASGASLSVLLPTSVTSTGRSLNALLADDRVRARIAADPKVRAVDATRVVVNDIHTPALRHLQGLTLDSIARGWRLAPTAALLRLLVADSGRTGALLFSMHEGDFERALREPWVGIGSDAGAQTPARVSSLHPRTFGTFPRVLARYSRERHILSLEEAVRRMTSLPAQSVGLRERGVLRPGYFADVIVFSPDVQDRATYETPARLATGMRYVLVNGVVTMDGGRMTRQRGGRSLQRSRCDD